VLLGPRRGGQQTHLNLKIFLYLWGLSRVWGGGRDKQIDPPAFWQDQCSVTARGALYTIAITQHNPHYVRGCAGCPPLRTVGYRAYTALWLNSCPDTRLDRKFWARNKMHSAHSVTHTPHTPDTHALHTHLCRLGGRGRYAAYHFILVLRARA